MKKALVLLSFAALMCSCGVKESKVMARFVPERDDDFIIENNLACGRFYGEALEGNPTSPGFDVWVKTPGALVANQRYIDELQNGLSYHIDHGNGKDCYKVAVSLGAGASVPLVDGQLAYPATNYRSYEFLEESTDKIVVVLHYPAWEVNGVQVSLDKKLTVEPDTYFFKAEDCYNGDFETLEVAAGIWDHFESESYLGEDRLAIWEAASDQSIEPEDGMIGVGLYMPEAEKVIRIDGDRKHIVATKTVTPGSSITYYFGSCWSKGDVKTAQEWFDIVKNLK